MPKLTSSAPDVDNRNRDFTALVEGAPDIIARLDDCGRLLYLNRAGEEAFGAGDARTIGGTADEFRSANEAFRIFGLAMRAVSSAGGDAFFDFQLESRGKNVHFNARVIAEHDRSGHLASRLMVARDVTRCMKAEIERDAALMREREARQEASIRLQALVEDHRQTLAMISHALRSPLNGIQSWTHVLESGLASDNNTVRRALAGIKTGIEQQVNLINTMLEPATLHSAEAERTTELNAERKNSPIPPEKVARTGSASG